MTFSFSEYVNRESAVTVSGTVTTYFRDDELLNWMSIQAHELERFINAGHRTETAVGKFLAGKRAP